MAHEQPLTFVLCDVTCSVPALCCWAATYTKNCHSALDRKGARQLPLYMKRR